MEEKPEISIQQTWQPLFSDVLDIVKCFDSSPETPNIAAALSLVFDITKQTESQKRLGHWLVQYIEPFLLNPIRGEQNLQEKTLAIATYLFVSERVKLNQKLPDEYLIKYIDYASSQSWFEDHFLAFYCGFLKDQIVACQKISEFFLQNYELVLAKKHIPAISQSLIILKGIITETESKRGCELLAILLGEGISFSHMLWGLWALSVNEQNSVSEKLITIVQSKISDAFWSTRRDSGILGILAIVSIGGEQEQIQEYVNKQTNEQAQEKVKITIENDSFSVDTRSISSAKTGAEPITIFDLCLALICLNNNKHDKVVYVTGLDDKNLLKVSGMIKRLSTDGGIELSRAEKNILNALSIFMIFLILCVVVYFQLGGVLSPDFTNLSVFNWSLEKFLIEIALIDYLLGAIQSARTEGNSLKGLLRLPIFRHWQDYQNRKGDNTK